MELKKTLTAIFLTPTLQIGREKMAENNYLNSYLKDIDRDVVYENCVYILFKPSDVDKFREFLADEYKRTKLVIDDYDYSGGYVVVVYSLDPKYKKDIQLIKYGRYSRTSKEFQALFPKIIKIKKNGLHRDEISLQYRIFNKTADLVEFFEKKFDVTFDQDQEVWEMFDEKNEILNINEIRKHDK